MFYVLNWLKNACINLCVYPDGEPKTKTTEVPRTELWIAVSLLLLIITGCVCGLVLFLRFRRTHCKLRKAEEHDVTMLKVPHGDDPTYGVRDSWCLIWEKYHKNVMFLSIHWSFVCFPRISLMNFVLQGVGQGCLIWYKGPWQDKFHWSSVLVSVLHQCCSSLPRFVNYFAVM